MKNSSILFPATLLFFVTMLALSFVRTDDQKTTIVSLDEDFLVSENLIKSYKTRVIKKVFARLKNAKGDFRSVKPQLFFVKTIPNDGEIAVAYATEGIIFFEEKTYDVCISVGKDSMDALAAILSHELTHCYEKHTWEDNFNKDFKKMEADAVVKDRYFEDEVQADYLGGFLAYAAGYQPFGVMAELYKKEYAAFNLTDKALEGHYPPMKERIEIAEKSEEKLKLLINYFEMSNWLIAVEEYDIALNYLNALEGQFQSREIYNNLGVVSFLAALEKCSPNEMNYAFPIELDANSRLGISGKGAEDRAYQVEKLLKAVEYFDKARSLDAFYPPAYLNSGCAHALLGFLVEDFADLDFDEAELAARRAIRLAESDKNKNWEKTIVDAHILLGIVAALRNNESIRPLQKAIEKARIDQQTDGIEAKQTALLSAANTAIDWMDKALKLDADAYLAQANKAILSGKKPKFSTKKGVIEDASEEKINDQRIVEMNLSRDDLVNAFYVGEDVNFAVKKMSEAKLFVHSKKKQATNFFVVGEDYKGETNKGVKIGASFQSVIDKYPNPPAPLGLTDGYFLVYEKPSLIFQFDNENRVKRWAIYRKVR